MGKTQRWKVLFFLLVLFFSAKAIGWTNKIEEKLNQLHREIILLNLVNGLYLSTDQMKEIIARAEEAQQVRDDYQKEMEQKKSEIERVLEKVRNTLLRGQEIPDDFKRKVHKIEEIQHQLQDDMGEKLINLESKIKKSLTKNQLVVINTYKPCIIPPAQGKIGQSVETAAKGVVRALSRIRQMPRDRYDLMKDMFVDFQVDNFERHVGFKTSAEKEQYRQEILGIFEKVRKMSDKEFLLQKGELAKQFIPEKSKIIRHRKNELGRVGRFLLDPALIPILKVRLGKS